MCTTSFGPFSNNPLSRKSLFCLFRNKCCLLPVPRHETDIPGRVKQSKGIDFPWLDSAPPNNLVRRGVLCISSALWFLWGWGICCHYGRGNGDIKCFFSSAYMYMSLDKAGITASLHLTVCWLPRTDPVHNPNSLVLGFSWAVG